MERITDPGAVPDLFGAGKSGFTDGDPIATIPPTYLNSGWFNGAQEALVRPIEAVGIVPNGADFNQNVQAAKRLAGGNVTAINASTALTPDHAGLVVVAAAAPLMLTLPAANAAGGIPLRYEIARTDVTTNGVTVARAGTDTIEGATSWAIAPRDRLVLVSDGASTWRVVAESAFGRSVAANGYYRLPSGLLIQWGTFTTSDSAAVTVTLPLAFSNAAYALTLGHNSFVSAAVSCLGALSRVAASFQARAYAVSNGSSVVTPQNVGGSFFAAGI